MTNVVPDKDVFALLDAKEFKHGRNAQSNACSPPTRPMLQRNDRGWITAEVKIPPRGFVTETVSHNQHRQDRFSGELPNTPLAGGGTHLRGSQPPQDPNPPSSDAENVPLGQISKPTAFSNSPQYPQSYPASGGRILIRTEASLAIVPQTTPERSLRPQK